MKLIIAGSRDIVLSIDELDELIKKYLRGEIKEVVSGCAQGIDTLGIRWATKNNIPIKKFKPDWSLGSGAPHICNRQMGDYADHAIVNWLWAIITALNKY